MDHERFEASEEILASDLQKIGKNIFELGGVDKITR